MVAKKHPFLLTTLRLVWVGQTNSDVNGSLEREIPSKVPPTHSGWTI